MATPQAMTPREIQAALQICQSTFTKWQACGKLKQFELLPRLGRLRRYSRTAVEAYLNRELPAAGLRQVR